MDADGAENGIATSAEFAIGLGRGIVVATPVSGSTNVIGVGWALFLGNLSLGLEPAGFSFQLCPMMSGDVATVDGSPTISGTISKKLLPRNVVPIPALPSIPSLPFVAEVVVVELELGALLDWKAVGEGDGTKVHSGLALSTGLVPG